MSIAVPEQAEGRWSGGMAPPARAATIADVALLAITTAAVVTVIAETRFGSSFAQAVTFDVSLFLLIVAGAMSLRFTRQRGNGRLMLVIAAVSAASDLSSAHQDVGPFAFLSDVLPFVLDALIGHLLLRWPADRLQNRAQRVTIGLAYAVPPACDVLADLFYRASEVFHVRDTVWWPTLVPDHAVGFAVYRVGIGTLAVLLAVFVVLIALRVIRAPRPARLELLPVVVAISLNVVGAVLQIALDTGAVVDGTLLQDLALAVVPLAFLVSVVVRRLQRAVAIEALSTRARTSDVGDVVRELRRAMGDRLLDVAVYSTDSGRYVTADDRDAPDIAVHRRALFVAADDGSPLARLDVAEALAERAELSGPIARVAVAALESARLRAELRARRAEQEAARARMDDLAAEGERLSRLLPGGLPEKLRSDPDALGRIDESVVTVLMSDVRGYTTISEHAPPSRLARQLQEHRAAMNSAILAEGGTVMQYVGDAVMAVFGAPFAQIDHAARAVRAAAGMHVAQERVNLDWAAAGWSAFRLGIGISTGAVATAILGSDERYEYTIVGDTVNLAQRLENEARPGGTTVMSDATLRASTGPMPSASRLPPLQVKGRVEPVMAYRIDAVTSGGPG